MTEGTTPAEILYFVIVFLGLVIAVYAAEMAKERNE